jgi:hypothetical protein
MMGGGAADPTVRSTERMKKALWIGSLLMLATAVWAQEVALPAACLWVQAGRVQSQGDVKVPPALGEATHIGMLRSLGQGLVLWTVDDRDDTGNLVDFSLSIANVTTGESKQYLKGLDPFGIGTDWMLQRAELTPSGKAVLLRVRLAGTGGFVGVYKLMLEPPCYWYEMNEGTDAWDSVSADGMVKARPSWSLTPDYRTAPTERDARAGTVIVAGKSSPTGRNLWSVKTWRKIPPYAEWDLGRAVVSPDGKQVAFTNPRGLWLAGVGGGEPKLLLPEAKGPVYAYDDPVWSSDGKGVYVTVTEYSNNDVRGVSLKWVGPAAPGKATVARPDAKMLCIPTK